MTAWVVEVEYHDLDGEQLTELHGPFRSQDAANVFRDRLASGVGDMEAVSWGWTTDDGNDRFLSIRSRQLDPPRTRARVADIKKWLADGNDQ